MYHRREKFGPKHIIMGVIFTIIFCIFVYESLVSRNIITGMDIRITDVIGQIYMNNSDEVLSAGKKLSDKDHIVVSEGSSIEIEVIL